MESYGVPSLKREPSNESEADLGASSSSDGKGNDNGNVGVKPEPSNESEADLRASSSSDSKGNDNGNVGVKPEPSDATSSSVSLIQLKSEVENVANATASSSTTQAFQAPEDPKETNYLERLCSKNAPEVLETGVSVGTELLDQLQHVLSTYKNTDVSAWHKTITELRAATEPTRTVVGVVGNTGAGKSSVINALLDEERLLPTNCLRACTASPTEISYNYSDDPAELYRAEIEFISSMEWSRELQVLFSDLLDGSGQVSREATTTDSDAGVAYAKLKAVYPSKTREMIAQADPHSLANEPAVRGILGTTKVLKERTAKELYRRMQHYVDSKEKSTGPADHRKRVDIPMEYWPLIKVVRIYTKANALTTGAVIVDLPGVQDSNAARAAVSAKYMKSCTGLWIVAPINRAVDDKTAKSLLGDSFKRQLKYDGTYSAVSFICSKTDDISITEAAESLGFEERIAEDWDTAERMKTTKKSLQSKIADLKEAKVVLVDQLDDCELKMEQWEDLKSEASDGKTVYAPSVKSKKRKRNGRPSKSRKNFDSDVDDDWEASDSDTSDKENSQPQEDRQPLTEEEIDEQISSLRIQRKKMREERRSIDSQVSQLRKDIQYNEAERNKILANLKNICIKGRNDYSTGAIKQDFAMGIKELDQENAVEEDDETFDPDQDVRDYEEVARSLPVFCVSSRAYQQISGRLEKDDFQSHGFLSVEDTEIPKLQEHAKKLTEAGRARHCRRFLNDLSQLTNSMKLWAANDGTRSHLTNSEKRREEMHLKKLLDQLEEELESSLKSLVDLIKKTLEEHIHDKINASIPSAVEAAPDTAAGWGAHRNEGGLFWATYKATVRRNGSYHGASGPRDFNQELFDPVARNLATGWERAFQRRLPAILDGFAKETALKLKQFHEAAKKRAAQRNTNVASLLTLSSQIQAHMRTVQAIPATILVQITELQREANRQFTPVICHAMMTAYQICTNESGSGSYARMKTEMTNHVDRVRHSMFRDAAEAVKGQLDGMCRAVKQGISDSILDVFDTIFVDYMRTLVGSEVDRSAKLPREELDMRRNVHKVLLYGDRMFAPVLGETASEASDDAVAPSDSSVGESKSNEAETHDGEGEYKLHEAQAHGDDADEGDHVESNNDISMVDPDEALQAQIRQEGANENTEVEDWDPFA